MDRPAETDIRRTILIFSSMTSCLLAFIFWIARIGFQDNSLSLVLNTLGMSLFILGVPFSLKAFINNTTMQKLSYASLTIGSITFAVLVGMLLGDRVTVLISGAGILLFLLNLVIYLRSSEIKISLLSVLGVLLFIGWVSGVAWGSGYQNPLFIERLVTGTAHIDTLFHSDISNMFKTYGMPSTGLDGLPILQYHYGSHWIFAQLSKLFGISPLMFYQLGYPVIFIPLFFQSILFFVVEAKKYFGHSLANWDIKRDILFWLVLFAAFVQFLPAGITDKSGLSSVDTIISESYNLSLTFLFLCSEMILHLVRKGKEKTSKFTNTEKLFIVIVVPLLTGVMFFLKNSTGALFGGLMTYLFLRLRLYRRKSLNLYFVFMFCAAVIGYRYGLSGGSFGGFEFLGYVRNSLNNSTMMLPLTTVNYFLVSFMWVWLYAIVRFRNVRLPEIKQLFKNGQIIDVELVVLLTVAGALPGLIMNIYGSSAFYFYNVQMWIALGLILAAITRTSVTKRVNNWLTENKLGVKLGFCLIIILFSANFLTNVGETFKNLVVTNLSTRQQLLAQYYGTTGEYQHGNVRKLRVVFNVQTALENNPNYKAIRDLQEIGTLPITEKQKTLLYIPKDNTVYWQMLPAKEIAFVAPAITGIAMVDGLPNYDPTDSTYAYGTYKRTEFTNSNQLQAPKDLLASVKAKGFAKLVIFGQKQGHFYISKYGF